MKVCRHTNEQATKVRKKGHKDKESEHEEAIIITQNAQEMGEVAKRNKGYPFHLAEIFLNLEKYCCSFVDNGLLAVVEDSFI